MKATVRLFAVALRLCAFFGGGLAGLAVLTGCTQVELEHKADAYNQAIADSNNNQILLNAVRASQRAPMSFVGFGDVSASPSVSGTAGGTFNFDPLGLTTYNLNPSVSVAGGFTTFTMNNLNSADFVHKLEAHFSPSIVAYFDDLKFPKELVQLIFVQEYDLPRREKVRIEAEVEAQCRKDPHDGGRISQFCDQRDRDRNLVSEAGCQAVQDDEAIAIVLNTGRDLCEMMRFQMFERGLRLLNHRLPFKTRTGQGVLYYLGELIAAQNYSTHRFEPKIFVESPDGKRRSVALFEVKRAVTSPPDAAVAVSYNGERFYVPRPEFGSFDEARSLQVLDIVSQVITWVTSKDALPKTSTVTLVQAR